MLGYLALTDTGAYKAFLVGVWLFVGLIMQAGAHTTAGSWGSPGRDIRAGNGVVECPTPRCCLVPAMRRGYVPFDSGVTTGPRTALLCRCIMKIRGGRILAAVGFYHQWIYTPDAEVGMSFVGADHVGYAGLPRPLSNVFRRMQVQNHAGLILGRDVLVKPIPDIEYKRLVGNMHTGLKGGYFPWANCYGWTREVISRSSTGSTKAR